MFFKKAVEPEEALTDKGLRGEGKQAIRQEI